jgi:hypothetical protein
MPSVDPFFITITITVPEEIPQYHPDALGGPLIMQLSQI